MNKAPLNCHAPSQVGSSLCLPLLTPHSGVGLDQRPAPQAGGQHGRTGYNPHRHHIDLCTRSQNSTLLGTIADTRRSTQELFYD